VSRTLPLLFGELDGVFARTAAGAITRRQFLADVVETAAALPARAHVVNLCEDRYLFTVAFAAVLLRGQPSLLPPNRTPQLVNEVARGWADSYCIADSAVAGLDMPLHRISAGSARIVVTEVPSIDAEQVAALLFTSGSTGQPRPNEKRWGEFIAGARATAARLGLDRSPVNLVATVPPQHMFGLETSVILPLAGMAAVDARRPLFPDDVRAVLAETPAPRAVVTTPFHLRTFTETQIEWPPIEFVLSATAPLSPMLAGQAEQAMRTRVLEIYGSTETGAFATRRTSEDQAWRPMDGFTVSPGAAGTFTASAPHLRGPVTLNDVIEPDGHGGFRLMGRQADLISVAG
jgi:acyl-coenzyme A synthetase/AMP-(fatty) acid ligase